MMRIFVGLLGMTATVLAVPANACSPVPGYRAPTNIELLDEADLVVLGRIGEQLSLPEEDDFETPALVQFTTLEVLKGAPPSALTVDGVTQGRFARLVRPEFTSLAETHESSSWGACTRQTYAKGVLVLAMFEQDGDQIRMLSYPFARQAEDVSGPDSLWLRAARLYLEVLKSMPAGSRPAVFAALRNELLESDDPDDRAIANDIDRYLAVAASGPKR